MTVRWANNRLPSQLGVTLLHVMRIVCIVVLPIAGVVSLIVD